MRSSEHAAHRLLMHSVHTSHSWLKVSPCVSFHVIHACAPVCCSLSVSPHPSFYFLVLFLFQLYLMSNSAPDEFSIKDPLCYFSKSDFVVACRLAGPQWCQCWRLCFVFCVSSVASPR